jgi:hypothetical protein
VSIQLVTLDGRTGTRARPVATPTPVARG